MFIGVYWLDFLIYFSLLCGGIISAWTFAVLLTQQTFVLMKTSWRRLEDVFRLRLQKTSSRRFGQDQYIRLGYMTSRRLQDVFKTFSRRLQDVLPRCLQDIFKTSSKRLAKTSSRHLQGRLAKISSRRFEDVLSS